MVDTLALMKSECANELRISDNTLSAWLKAGKGPDFVRIGRKYLFSKTSIEKFLQNNSRPPAVGSAEDYRK